MLQEIDRRTFLKLAGVAVLGLVLKASGIGSAFAESKENGNLMLLQTRTRALGLRHVVGKGETFQEIVRNHYGSAIVERCAREKNLTTLVATLNDFCRQIDNQNRIEDGQFDPLLIRPGQVINLPSERYLGATWLELGSDMRLFIGIPGHSLWDKKGWQYTGASGDYYWAYGNFPGTLYISQESQGGQTLKGISLGTKGKIKAGGEGKRTALDFEVVKKEVLPRELVDDPGDHEFMEAALNPEVIKLFTGSGESQALVVTLRAYLP